MLQRVLTRSNKSDLYLDLAELITGLLLVGFLWTHMIFVATIILGADTFNMLSEFLDKYYLSYIGIPFIVVVALFHFVIAGRRIPTRIQEQRIVWQHAKMLRHTDTWTWVFQAITGMAILVLAGIHVWMVITGWPIRAMNSADRMYAFWWFYLILLVIGEYHAGFGLYRQFVKWGWFPRKPIGYVTKVITAIILVLGLAAMVVFVRLGGGA